MYDDELNGFYTIDPATKEVIYDITDYRYVTLRDAFAMSGIDILSLKTENELQRTWDELGESVMQVVIARALSRKPRNLEDELVQAKLRGDHEEANRIREKLRKIRSLRLSVVISQNKP